MRFSLPTVIDEDEERGGRDRPWLLAKRRRPWLLACEKERERERAGADIPPKPVKKKVRVFLSFH